MAVRRRSFFSGATNAPGTDPNGGVGFDPAAIMPAERPATPFSPAPTPGPQGGGVGGSVDPQTGKQAGGAAPGTEMFGTSIPPSPPQPPSPEYRAASAATGAAPMSPATARRYTQPGMGTDPAAAAGGLSPSSGALPMPMVLGILKLLGRM